tara:strand:+ start:1957 stop:2319 length:363 start_codon:yes stop_codon:yes gene_type:complete
VAIAIEIPQVPPVGLLRGSLGPSIQEFVLRVVFSVVSDPGAFSGQRVSSWWRSQGFNARVGGATFSQHLLGLAWDFAPGSERLVNLLNAQGLVAIAEEDHTHVQLWTATELFQQIEATLR